MVDPYTRISENAVEAIAKPLILPDMSFSLLGLLEFTKQATPHLSQCSSKSDAPKSTKGGPISGPPRRGETLRKRCLFRRLIVDFIARESARRQLPCCSRSWLSILPGQLYERSCPCYPRQR